MKNRAYAIPSGPLLRDLDNSFSRSEISSNENETLEGKCEYWSIDRVSRIFGFVLGNL